MFAVFFYEVLSIFLAEEAVGCILHIFKLQLRVFFSGKVVLYDVFIKNLIGIGYFFFR
jgi:hypothetical protein